MPYIWETEQWPSLRWDDQSLAKLVARTSREGAAQRTTNQGSQPSAGRLRGETHVIEMGEAHQELSGHGLPRHHGSRRARRIAQGRRRRPKHQLLAGRAVNCAGKFEPRSPALLSPSGRNAQLESDPPQDLFEYRRRDLPQLARVDGLDGRNFRRADDRRRGEPRLHGIVHGHVARPAPILGARNHQDPEKPMSDTHPAHRHDQRRPILPCRPIGVGEWHLYHVSLLKARHTLSCRPPSSIR